MLSFVYNPNFLKNRIVFSSGTEGDIYVYSNGGKYLSKMNRKGEGPEEYPSSSDIWVSNDTLNIYTQGKFVKRYRLDGTYLGRTNMDIRAGHILPYENGYVMDVSFTMFQDTLRNQFAYSDKNFENVELFLPIETGISMSIFTSKSSLSMYNNSVVYLGIMQDTAYIFNRDTLSPFIHYNFGDDWVEFDEKGKPKGVFSSNNDPNIIWNINQVVGDDYIFVSVFGGENSKSRYLVDRNSGKSIRMDLAKGTEDDGNYILNGFFWEEDVLIGSSASVDVLDLIDLLNEDQWSVMGDVSLEAIESSENPVIVKIKFKDF